MITYKTYLSVITLACSFACAPHSTSVVEKAANTSAVNALVASSRVIEQPTSLRHPASFEYVQLLDRNRWLIADFDHVWRTEDGGQTWRQVYSVRNRTNLAQHIKGLSFVDARTGYLIVDQQVMRSDDGGNNWYEVGQLDEAVSAQSCYFVDELHGWCVGVAWLDGYLTNPKIPQYEGAVFATKDGGRTWKRQQATLPSGYFPDGSRWILRDVYFSDRNTGWVVGEGMIFWTTDGGKTWRLADAKKLDYKHIRFLDDEYGWATQREGEEFAITNDGGRRWNVSAGLPGFGAQSPYIVFLTPRYGFATLVSLYETKNQGRKWSRRTTGSIDRTQPLQYIERAMDGTLIALGLNERGVTTLVSTDDGMTWQPTNVG